MNPAGTPSTRLHRSISPCSGTTTRAIRPSGRCCSSRANYPNDGKPIALAGQYGRMGEAAARFVWRQTNNTGYNGPSVVLKLDKVVNAPGFEFKDLAWWNGISDAIARDWVGARRKVPLR